MKLSMLFLGLAALVLSACGPSLNAGTTPVEEVGAVTGGPLVAANAPQETTLSPVELLPASSTGVVVIDFAALRRSEHYDTLAAAVAALVGINEQSSRAIVDRTQEAAAGLVEEGGHLVIGLMVLRVESLAPQQIEFLHSPDVQRRLGDAVALGNTTWLIGKPDLVAAALAQARSPSELSGSMRDMLGELNVQSAMFALALAPSPDDRAEFARSLRVVPASHLDALHAFGITASFSPGLELRVQANAADPAVAREIAENAREQVDRLRNHFFVSALGLGPVVNAARIGNEADRATLRISLNSEETTNLLSRREELLELARALASQ